MDFNKISFGLDIATALSVIGACGMFIRNLKNENKIKKRERDTEFKIENTKSLLGQLSDYQEQIFLISAKLENSHNQKQDEQFNSILHNDLPLTLQRLEFFLKNKARLGFNLFFDEESVMQLEELNRKINEFYVDFKQELKNKKFNSPIKISTDIGLTLNFFYDKLKNNPESEEI